MKRMPLYYKGKYKSGSTKKGGSAPELFFNNFRSRAELKWGEKYEKILLLYRRPACIPEKT
jgi:hypothetical protein